MKLRAITAKEAKKLTLEGGYCWTPDGSKTFYAANEDGEVYEYYTKAARDNAVEKGRE